MFTEIIMVDNEIQSGEPVFSQTRVPVKSLFDYISTGESIESYLEDYPYVTREQVNKVLGLAGKLLLQTSRVFAYENSLG